MNVQEIKKSTLVIDFSTGAGDVETISISGVVVPINDDWVNHFVQLICAVRCHIIFTVFGWELVEE